MWSSGLKDWETDGLKARYTDVHGGGNREGAAMRHQVKGERTVGAGVMGGLKGLRNLWIEGEERRSLEKQLKDTGNGRKSMAPKEG
jgi:hypothetical protein